MAALAEPATFIPVEDSATDLLRLTTAGSVDDGKSTLIGRLLYDSKAVYEDQLASVRKATRHGAAGGLDLSLLTDGLRAEREQGITIDVAYRYFATARRKFIIADTPGHEQYTRNMATGASTADLAIILIDARHGVLEQSRRHAYIASLLGIPHLAVAVNKMDLVDFREDVFRAIEAEFAAFVQKLGPRHLQFIPMSALEGDNVARRSDRMSWYDGPSLLEHLETVPVAASRDAADFRFPVQYVIRPDLDFRGFAGQIASGVVRRGDTVTVLPSGRTSRISRIVTWDGDLEEAFAPMSVTLCLEDEIDISRGDMLVHGALQPARRFAASLVWMNEKPLAPGRPYLLKHTTQTMQARVPTVRHKVDMRTLDELPVTALALNEIGVVELETQRPLLADPYAHNRATGSFILIDTITNETLAAGMVAEVLEAESRTGRVTPEERAARIGHRALLVRLPDATREQAEALERELFDLGVLACTAPGEAQSEIVGALHAGLVVVAYGSPWQSVLVPLGLSVFDYHARPDLSAAEIATVSKQKV